MNYYADAVTAYVATAYSVSVNCYADGATATAMLPLLLRHRTDTLPLPLLISFATIATAIAYADASTGRLALLTVYNATCYCYRNCYDANCYYERVIASTRARTIGYADTATANEFCYNCYCDRLR